jgi:hypothetical protein
VHNSQCSDFGLLLLAEIIFTAIMSDMKKIKLFSVNWKINIFIVAPCILFQFTKKDQQMHLKSILKTHTARYHVCSLKMVVDRNM